MKKILLVDDERLFVKGLKRSLEANGYEVNAAYDGKEALVQLTKKYVDLVILDIMLPEMDGLEVCRQLRQFSNVPVIMLTAKGDDIDKIVGLEIGADDYLSKPFNTRELLARVKAIIRRTNLNTLTIDPAGQLPLEAVKLDTKELIKFGDLEIDMRRQKVWVKGQPIDLTVREYDLLLTLVSHPARIYTREILLEQVWGSRYFGEPRVVDVYVRRLRQKIEVDPARPEWIMTRWGSGYYFRE
jgi:DNA-binding response OmpR family regulator